MVIIAPPSPQHRSGKHVGHRHDQLAGDGAHRRSVELPSGQQLEVDGGDLRHGRLQSRARSLRLIAASEVASKRVTAGRPRHCKRPATSPPETPKPSGFSGAESGYTGGAWSAGAPTSASWTWTATRGSMRFCQAPAGALSRHPRHPAHDPPLRRSALATPPPARGRSDRVTRRTFRGFSPIRRMT